MALEPGDPTASKLLYVPGTIPAGDEDEVNWNALTAAKGAWENDTDGCGATVPQMRIESGWTGVRGGALILGMRALGWHVVRVNVIANSNLGTSVCATADRGSFNINRIARCGDSRESTVYRRHYRVRATSANGDGAWSNVVELTSN